MRDYLELGSVPPEESCQQVGTKDYDRVKAKAECVAYKHQLERIWPDGDFGVKSCPHDFGSYFEVVAFFSDEQSTNIAFEAESTGPATWDSEALKELENLSGTQKLSFEQWLSKVDNICIIKVGIGVNDGVDFPSREIYDSGQTPEQGFDEWAEWNNVPKELI